MAAANPLRGDALHPRCAAHRRPRRRSYGVVLLGLHAGQGGPVIRATHVHKPGVPTRGEMTGEMTGALYRFFERMAGHMNKGTPQLRPLKSR